MTQIFILFLLTSVMGTALAMILALLRPITRKVFSGNWHYYMWLVVLLVMILPIRFTLPVTPTTTSPISETVTITDNQTETIDTPIITETQMVIQEQPVQFEKASTIQVIKDHFSSEVPLLSFIWLSGAILSFMIKIISYLVFLIKIHKHSEIISCPAVQAYTNRNIKTRVSNTICSPLMIGIIRPTLLLPKTNITPEQLDNVLAHEMTHLKRNDILYKWFVSIVKCVHWFNPAIYFINRQINIDCEISCDLLVVREMDEQDKKGYVETILSLLTHNNSKGIPLTTGMTGNKKTLKKRFSMIKKKLNPNKKVAIISGIIAVLILAITLFASGILNGTFLKTDNNSIMELNTDKSSGNDFNLLFVGLDNDNRADTIMLLTVKENGIKGLSIPRNTIFGEKMISDILATENGDQELIDTIKTTLSVPIHYYAKMNLSAVKEIVDNVGGIDFEVPMDMVYEDPYQDLHINLKKGVHTLNGEGVCQLLQFRRGYPEGDLSRIQLHQQFIKEFIKQKLSKDNIDKAPEIFKVISGNIKTNYPISNLKQDMKIISAINSNNIIFETISGRVTIHNEMSVYEPDVDNQASSDMLTNNINSFIWPSESTTISNGFGKRVHPITGEEKTHNGIDISAPENSLVVSSIQGKVIDTGFDNKFGNYIIIENDNGVRCYYGHLSSVEVAKGDKVKGNTVVGKVGKTGTATGANLHFEIQINGEYKDPEQIFSQISLSTTEKELSVTNKTANTTKTYVKAPSKKIKSSEVSDELYGGFEHLVLKNADTNKIKQELNNQGIAETKKSSVDLTKNYVVKDYSSERTNVEADKNGNISLYFSVNSDNLFDVRFYDAETGEDVGSYGVLANNENAYTFIGFEKGKAYNVEVQGQTKDDWAIEGNYIIY